MKINAYDEDLRNDDDEVKHRMKDSEVIYRAYLYGQITKEKMDELLYEEVHYE